MAETPEVVNRFKEIRVLGKGASSQIVLAQDQSDNNRLVVLKVPIHEDSEIGDTARLAGLLEIDHPNLVKHLGFDRHNGKTVTILEYVEGSDLRKIVGPAATARAPLELDWALRVAADICSGLAAAHNARLFHTAIKPENILVRERDGIAMLGGFGVCQTPRSGSPYSAPESWAGEASFQADLWSLSVTLYEMVTGTLPFAWTGDIETFKAKVGAEAPAPPNRLSPGIDDSLNALILRGLEKRADARFQTAEDMLSALEACSRRSRIELSHKEDPPQEVPRAEKAQSFGTSWVSRIGCVALVSLGFAGLTLMALLTLNFQNLSGLALLSLWALCALFVASASVGLLSLGMLLLLIAGVVKQHGD